MLQDNMFAFKLQLNFLWLHVVIFSVTTLGLGHGGEKVVVKDGDDVVLPCSLSDEEDIEFKLFDWKKVAQKDEPRKEVFFYDAGNHYNNGYGGQSEQFKGRVSHFQEELKLGNASITIRNTKVTDSGNYTCDFPRLRPAETFQIELVVAATKPFTTILNATALWFLLQCEVRGAFPKPAVEWRDGAGNKLPAKEPQVSERGGSYDIILQTTVTKTDNYQCVVTQETISHQTEATIFVPICDSSHKVSIGWFYSTLVLGCFVIVVALFKAAKFIKRRNIKGKNPSRNPAGMPMNP